MQAIDVAGAGGTNWQKVEELRFTEQFSQDTRFTEGGLRELLNWGIPTAVCLEELKRLRRSKDYRSVQVIASGGITNGVEIAKALALGADLAALAKPFLKAAFEPEGADAVKQFALRLMNDLRATMFLVGAKNIKSLKQNADRKESTLIMPTHRAERNRTLTLTEHERTDYAKKLLILTQKVALSEIENQILCNDLFDVLDFLPEDFASLLILDPPYNLTKSFNGTVFQARSTAEYIDYLESWMPKLIKTLKPTASVYVCGDWRMSGALQLVLEKYLIVRNRITWEREKGRGATSNWKNCSEDIWFCTVSNTYTFNADAVKLKRRVLAPYREEGVPKDWEETEDGNFRLTAPSNLWTDITIPFWSMPENTDHPTQKPEKLLAKLILASSNEGDLVFDPFLGSGTTAVVAKKLNRRFFRYREGKKLRLFSGKATQLGGAR